MPTSSMINPMIRVSQSMIDLHQFDAIIDRYKRTISKTNYSLKELNRNELLVLILKLRQELFHETTEALLNNDTSDENENIQFLSDFVDQTLDQNRLLFTLIDDLIREQSVVKNKSYNFKLDTTLTMMLGILFLCLLILFCQ